MKTSMPIMTLVGLVLALGLMEIETAQGARATSERGKPTCTIGIVGREGDVNLGASLSAAILKVLAESGLAESVGYFEIDKAPEERERGITISTAHAEFETAKRHYAAVSFPTMKDSIKAMVTGASGMDGAILVVSVAEGLTPEASKFVRLAEQVGVPAMVVFLDSKANEVADPEIVKKLELETRQLLTKYGYPGDKVPIIAGSSDKALKGDDDTLAKQSITRLLAAVDDYIPQPPRPIDKPFLMAVEDVFSVPRRGTMATGRIDRGVIKVGEEVEIVGLLDTRKTIVTGLEIRRRRLEQGVAGQNVAILLRGVKKEEVKRGQVLAKPGSVTPHTEFEAAVYLLTKEEGGRQAPRSSGYKPQFYFRTTDVIGEITLPSGVEQVMPGENAGMAVKLTSPIALEKGLRFSLREGGRTLGVGVVTKIVK